MEEDLRPDEPIGHDRADEAEAAYRGFLFADLRGYTAYVERHGDAVAADLLDAYRELVRSEVTRHTGAEIRTEGDSFYVVFGSARRAVACGLAIVAAADRASRDYPARPIKVGIGINAGETVQRGEGFVGTAVNLAARLCAEAREGEVLVTPAVRDAVGAGAGLRFVSRGTRRLKGIARPIALYAVRPADQVETKPTRFARGRWLPIAVALLSVPILIAGGWALLGTGRGEGGRSPGAVTESSASPSIAEIASASPAVDPNRYPTAAEAELVAAVGENISRDCRRADEGDRPLMLIDSATAQELGVTREQRIAAHVGIACEIQSLSAPDTFHLWVTRQIIDIRSVDVGELLIFSRAGTLGIPRGDCGAGGPAYERWEVGDLGGWLLCYETYGDAIIEWSYDDRALFGRADRPDGDLSSLLRWWTNEARLLAP